MSGSKRRPASSATKDTSSCNLDSSVDSRCWRLRPRMPCFSSWESGLASKKRLQELEAAARATYARVSAESFWIGVSETPQTLLESFALEVFWHHVDRLALSRKSLMRDGVVAGAEYWVQRRSPNQAVAKRGMDFHFDQDVAALEDEGVMVLPLVSTVTYCSDGGAPLAVLAKPTLDVGPEGMFLVPLMEDDSIDVYITFPSRGRHVAFRGNQLHGCPPELEEQSVERISVLVNIWVHHRPFDLRQLRPPVKNLPKELFCDGVGRRAPIRFKPNNPVAATRARIQKDNHIVLEDVCFGPWSLMGVRLPTQLGGGVWVVRQPRGLMALSLRSKRSMKACVREAAARAEPKRRPKATVASAVMKKRRATASPAATSKKRSR
ncbi:unnamed protein product [Prorocentrum cordatum]|uniref:Uncharacterized protein n=1 Tax=Prorocentrum cordatum TaxID=2364126 RepID=A0ABN9RS08_9DINO|nr:unnamed protein product [Polarella glacialis]